MHVCMSVCLYVCMYALGGLLTQRITCAVILETLRNLPVAKPGFVGFSVYSRLQKDVDTNANRITDTGIDIQ